MGCRKQFLTSNMRIAYCSITDSYRHKPLGKLHWWLENAGHISVGNV